jgi:hypothetical protein
MPSRPPLVPVQSDLKQLGQNLTDLLSIAQEVLLGPLTTIGLELHHRMEDVEMKHQGTMEEEVVIGTRGATGELFIQLRFRDVSLLLDCIGMDCMGLLELGNVCLGDYLCSTVGSPFSASFVDQ